MDSKAAKRAALETDTHPFDTQEAIPGLLNDIVISHILSDDSLLDPRDLARLRADGGYLCRFSMKNIPLDETTFCLAAAIRGNLNMLKWARANGAPWDKWTCYSWAEQEEWYNLMDWIRANGCCEGCKGCPCEGTLLAWH